MRWRTPMRDFQTERSGSLSGMDFQNSFGEMQAEAEGVYQQDGSAAGRFVRVAGFRGGKSAGAAGICPAGRGGTPDYFHACFRRLYQQRDRKNSSQK